MPKNTDIFCMNGPLLTIEEAAAILQINDTALLEMMQAGLIPFIQIHSSKGTVIRIDPASLTAIVSNGISLDNMENRKIVDELKALFDKDFPGEIEKLKQFSSQFIEQKRKPKGYSLAKVKNKKLGFVYYVRYVVNGKLVPSRWCTFTNNREIAEKFAIENRERLLKEYFQRIEEKIPNFDIYAILKKYYSENSPYLKTDIDEGRELSEDSRKTYQNFIIKQFIPFLRKEKINEASQIDTRLLIKMRNQLRAGIVKKNGTVVKKGIRPQTINHYISYISKIFDRLIIENKMATNPCRGIKPLKIGKTDKAVTGCYDIYTLKGAFNKRWKNELSYLLCLIIYTANMRNSEIERIQLIDFFKIGDYYFLDIPESKTKNGIRIVPIHNYVWKKIMAYVKKHKLKPNDYIFKLPQRIKLGSDIYKDAFLELAEYTGYSIEQLKKENIRFYSGRHFWKTIMNSEDLGIAEEYFMGHKINNEDRERIENFFNKYRVTNNVKELYLHRDKQGNDKLLEKVQKVFDILDKYILHVQKVFDILDKYIFS